MVAAVLLLAALAAVIGFVALRPDDTDGTGTQAEDTPSSSSPSSPASEDDETQDDPAGAPTEPSSASTATSTAEQPTTTPPPVPEPTPEPAPEPAGDPLSAANIQAFLADYHRQVIQDPASAYDRTGPTLRANIGSREDYVAYWSQFSDVTLSEVQAVDGQNRVTGRLDWTFTSGETRSALRQFTLIEQNGQLILDSELDP